MSSLFGHFLVSGWLVLLIVSQVQCAPRFTEQLRWHLSAIPSLCQLLLGPLFFLVRIKFRTASCIRTSLRADVKHDAGYLYYLRRSGT